MAVNFPNIDLPSGLRGGSDIWDGNQASQILLEDFFQTAPLSGNGLMFWNGSTWVNAALKFWNGTVWQEAVLKRWNGSTWITV